MEITAALVKELRERTGSGMMECKKALGETQGNIEQAIEWMRKAGLAKADKKAGRIAAEGRIVVQVSADARAAVLLEVNCETDFVAKGDDFIHFADSVAQLALRDGAADVAALSQMTLPGGNTVEHTRKELVAKIGENISLRRVARATAPVIGAYLHGTRIGVLVEMEGGNPALAKDIAMHVAASKPICVASSDVSPDLIEKEKEIYRAQAAESGKPANIIEKMIMGRVQKFLAEVSLLGQPFVKNPDQTVEQLLKEKNAKVTRFTRFEVGEGIEKVQTDFAAEVMAQVRGS